MTTDAHDPDTAAAADAVHRFADRYRTATGYRGPLPAVAFGADQPTADALAALVAAGVKTATTSVLAAYHHEQEPLPQPGDQAIVVDGSGRPVAVIEVTEVRVRRYGDIDEAHAHAEGEGDRTLAGWRAAHEPFLDDTCAGLGQPYDDNLELVCERFTVAWAESPPQQSRSGRGRHERQARPTEQPGR
jgi:uncharacterized protein YhfF